jgi:hypothetical protein
MSTCPPQCSVSVVPSGRAMVTVVEAGRAGVGGAFWSVDADDGVEMHEAAPLILGDLGVGQSRVVAELAYGHAEQRGEASAQGAGEAVPELAGVGLPEDGAGVVVGLGVERGPGPRVVGVVVFPAGAGDDEPAR